MACSLLLSLERCYEKEGVKDCQEGVLGRTGSGQGRQGRAVGTLGAWCVSKAAVRVHRPAASLPLDSACDK